MITSLFAWLFSHLVKSPIRQEEDWLAKRMPPIQQQEEDWLEKLPPDDDLEFTEWDYSPPIIPTD